MRLAASWAGELCVSPHSGTGSPQPHLSHARTLTRDTACASRARPLALRYRLRRRQGRACCGVLPVVVARLVWRLGPAGACVAVPVGLQGVQGVPRVCPVPVAGVAPPGCRADHICAQRSAARAPRRARRFRGARIIWIQILRRERDWIQIPIRIPHSRFSNTNTSTLHWNWSAGSTLLRTPAIITSASRPLVAGVRMGMPPSAAAARR